MNDQVFVTPSWDYTASSVTSLQAFITYSSEAFYAGPSSGLTTASLTGTKFTSLSGAPSNLSVLHLPQTSLYNQPCSGFYGLVTTLDITYYPTISPVAGYWSQLEVSCSSNVWGTYFGYQGAAGGGVAVEIDLDPVYGTVDYVGPGESSIHFGPYNPQNAEQAVFFYSLAVGVNNDPNTSQEILEGPDLNAFSASSQAPGQPVPFNVNSLIIARAPAPCGDERDALISEYVTYGVKMAPTCADFTQTASPGGYPFSDYNVANNYSWALARLPLTWRASFGIGLNYLVQLLGSATIVNGYRSPSANYQQGGDVDDRSQFGDSIQIANTQGTDIGYAFIRDDAILAEAEVPFGYGQGPCGKVCVIVNFDNMLGLYAP